MKKIKDNRGLFFLDNEVDYDQIFIATNEARHTFRGMHFQSNPYQVKYLILGTSLIDRITISEKDKLGL